MNVVCIDPGIVAVGVVHVRVSDTFDLVELCFARRVNMTLAGGGHVYTYIDRFICEYADVFAAATHIVMERQPIQSAGMPLELLFRERFAAKCIFISPQTLHKQFGLQDLEYDGRKAKCVGIVSEHLRQWASDGLAGASQIIAYIDTLDRKHDVCDAMLLLLAWLVSNRKRHKSPPEQTPFAAFVERFRHVPSAAHAEK